MPRWFVWAAGLLLAVPAAAAEVDFAHDIAPVLKQYCGKCHTGTQLEGGLSLNTRETLLKGGESGAAVVVGSSAESELLARITAGEDDALKMPPEGPRVPEEKVALLKQWIDGGLAWEAGFTFGERAYEPPLHPERPELPPALAGRDHPIDRILDAYLVENGIDPPAPLSDERFARRVWLDVIGLLPTPEELERFLEDPRPDKRARLVEELLARDVDYAEHWLTFWNDLLRNDYTGTGFITGGRTQISKWLYAALVSNKPYDEFARELIAPPTPESAGFIQGIRWRGEVSAGQTVEIQFAQSIGQSFLGINLKCASCHDSFIDRWKLDEAYGLAAIYATGPLEIHRCDKPVGRMAAASWLFPEIGQIDPNAPQPERLGQLAELMTHPENGRFTRTIVNRIWHRLMGHGIVHPTDAMQTEPWNTDLLNYLGVHLSDNDYDLKKTIELIVTSAAYQSATEAVGQEMEDSYRYAGPRAKRMTAEQFMDAVWQLTGTAPLQFDAPVVRGSTEGGAEAAELAGRWIWSKAEAASAAQNEAIALRKTWTEAARPERAFAVVTCDNSFVLYVNGQQVAAGDNWERPVSVSLAGHLKQGPNEVLVVARNGGSDPNPAGLYFEARIQQADGTWQPLGSDASWQWSATLPNEQGQYAEAPQDFAPAVLVAQPEIWAARAQPALSAAVAAGIDGHSRMVRASLVKSDFLMRSLGRPNRDQIVTSRPNELSTLEAIDLSNGEVLATALERGANQLLARSWETPTAFVEWLYVSALSRKARPEEVAALTEVLGPQLTSQGIQDVLWAVVMQPEFQLVR